MIDDDSLKNLERLHQLKTAGVITEADFEAAKQKLLQGERSAPSAMAASPAIVLGNDDWFGWATLPLKRYADFSGRSSRKEFWMFMLLAVGAMFVCGLFVAVDEYGPLGKLGTIALALVFLGTLVPTFAAMARRFHDQDMSGWFTLLNLIPYIGALVALVFMLIEGKPGPNRFGDDPKEQ